MLSFVVVLHLRTPLCEDRDFEINLANNSYLTTSKGEFEHKTRMRQNKNTNLRSIYHLLVFHVL